MKETTVKIITFGRTDVDFTRREVGSQCKSTIYKAEVTTDRRGQENKGRGIEQENNFGNGGKLQGRNTIMSQVTRWTS